jgi:hypothetical protein
MMAGWQWQTRDDLKLRGFYYKCMEFYTILAGSNVLSRDLFGVRVIMIAGRCTVIGGLPLQATAVLHVEQLTVKHVLRT